ncbi:AfsR/SARP family transcriptional regulator [Geodermatophilus marinus]|uniref:AfsR/SARP family transcriptional regulator n=1 Tax=Geodermatophilus sp. LHW52908 TaxID=2303986 RepID=UPI000E3D6A24|nr:BTAD domain-containing putative transcriptional regulator [Geodermatophilus sp. LHW52908]RFU19091.1 hypothetical protein D0Z06_23160 [Geodermatophilus sp. LHW52908]
MHASGPEFSVLGALEVRRDGQPVPLTSGRQRVVLAALLIGAGEPVSVDRLVDAGWDERPPAHPRAAVHTVVSRLRRLLGEGATLEAEPGGYVLRVPAGAVDAVRFEALCDRAAGLPAAAAAQALDAALGLWRGPAYTEFAGYPFARAEATRLDELRAAAIERRAELALELGNPDVTIRVLEELLAAEPLRERAAGLLMGGLYAAGRPADALDRYRQVRARLAEELGVDPSPGLQRLQVRILGHDVPSVRRRVPSPPGWRVSETSFVGRDHELADLIGGVCAHRLVTVVGTGGVGKSRLVAEALPDIGRRLGLPVTVVELGGTTGAQIDGAVAAALDLRGAAEDLRGTVLEYLGTGEGLVVLDGCEHAVDDVRRFVEEVLRRCPGTRLVVTGRRRLAARDERVLRLAPLPTPPEETSADRLAGVAAVRLFVDRMGRMGTDGPPGETALQLIGDVCRRLDGVPLAIELAATRATALGLRPLRDRLGDGLDVLAEDGDRPGLRAVVSWSYGLLAPDEQAVLAVLSVFAGAFDLAAAERVAGPVARAPVAPCLARLVDASLVTVHGAVEVPRYRLLDLVRAFAAERLAERGLEDEAQEARARWVRALAGTVARGPGGDRSVAVEQLDRQRNDVLAAVRWALDRGDPGLAGEITGALRVYSHWQPDAELLTLVCEVAEDGDVRRSGAAPSAFASGGLAAAELGDLARAERLAAAALRCAAEPTERQVALVALGVVTLYRGQHDRSAGYWHQLLDGPGATAAHRADAHATLALLGCFSGDEGAARRHADLACRAAAEVGGGYRAFATYALGERWLLTDPEAAVAVLRVAVEQAEQARVTHVTTVARIALLSALTRMGRHEEALTALPGLLHHLRRAGVWPQMWTALRIGAELLERVGETETAALVLAAAAIAPSAPVVTGADVARYRRLERRIRARIGRPAADRAAALAAALPRAQVVEHTLAAVQRHAVTPAG